MFPETSSLDQLVRNSDGDRGVSRVMRRPLGCFLLIATISFSVWGQDGSSPSPDQMEAFLEARLAADRGDTTRALDLFDDLIEESEDPILFFERARVHLDIRDFELAERDLRKAIELDPALPDARRALGRLLLDRSRNDGARIDEALDHLMVAYQSNPNDLGTGLMISQVYNGTGRPARALNVLEGLIERMPDNRSVNHQYAQVLIQLGRETEAIPHLEVVVAGEPFYEPAAAQLIDLYEETGSWAESAALLERWTANDRNNIELRKRLGFVQLRAGEAEKAVNTLGWVMGQVSGDFGLEYLFAEALAASGRDAEAEGYYESLLERDPSNVDLQVSHAFNQLSLEKLDEAARIFRALERRPEIDDRVRRLSRTQLAAIAHRQEEWDEALRLALSALTEEEPNSQALGISLDVYERQERFEDALDLIRKRRKLFPDSEMLEARQLQFQMLGERDRAARRTLNAMLERSEDTAVFALQVLAQLERWPEAAESGRKAVSRWGDQSIPLLFQLGASLERSGEYESSVETFQKLLAIDPDHAPSQNYLGYMWADKGENLEEALGLIEKAVEADPDNGAYVDSLGWVHYRLGNLELADEYLRKAADLDPGDPTIREHVGDVQALLGQLDLARESYERALDLEPEDPVRIRSKLSEIDERIASSEDRGETN